MGVAIGGQSAHRQCRAGALCASVCDAAGHTHDACMCSAPPPSLSDGMSRPSDLRNSMQGWGLWHVRSAR